MQTVQLAALILSNKWLSNPEVCQTTMNFNSDAEAILKKSACTNTYWAYVRTGDEVLTKINRVAVEADNQFNAYMLLKAIYGDLLLSKCAHPAGNRPATGQQRSDGDKSNSTQVKVSTP